MQKSSGHWFKVQMVGLNGDIRIQIFEFGVTNSYQIAPTLTVVKLRFLIFEYSEITGLANGEEIKICALSRMTIKKTKYDSIHMCYVLPPGRIFMNVEIMIK